MMTNPTPLVVWQFMAELQGWTDLKRSPIDNRLWGLPPQDTVAELDLGKYMLVPNWPGDRNASRDLPVEDYHKLNDAHCSFENDYFAVAISKREMFDVRYPAWLECMMWIFYMGYRWDDKALEFKPVK